MRLMSRLRNLIPQSSEHVTIELREVVKTTDIFERCPDDIYPIWDEDHRGELERKIIEHYYFRQIGFETVGRFKFELNARMREIMPRMVKIYATTQYKYNPIENYNMEERGKDTRTANSNSLGKYSETPQGELQNLIDGKYLTNATHGTDESKAEDNHEFTRHGNIGVTSTQQLIQQERDVTIDLDRMIIAELNDLFLGVY